MPAAMVLPTAAAMPNHMPRTFRRPPRERAEGLLALLSLLASLAVVLDASIVLDNGGSGSLLGRGHDSYGWGKCKLESGCEVLAD
jgi:hypothetical protein